METHMKGDCPGSLILVTQRFAKVAYIWNSQAGCVQQADILVMPNSMPPDYRSLAI